MYATVALAKKAFATTYALVLKAQGAHWNVEGPDFLEYHELYEKIYSEIYDSIDPFAEHIRTLHTYIDASFAELDKESLVSTAKTSTNYCEDLLAANKVLLDILKDVFNLSSTEGLDGFAAFISDRMAEHSKHIWMLESSLK